MALAQRETRSHHFGVTMLNLALNSLVQDRVYDSFAEATEALEALGSTSGLVEHSAARVLVASIHLRLGRHETAEKYIEELESGAKTYIPNEAFADAAGACDSFGSRLLATRCLGQIGDSSTHTRADKRILAITRARMAIRSRDAAAAERELAAYPDGVPTTVGAIAELQQVRAHIALIRADPNARTLLEKASSTAISQGATAMRRVCDLLIAASQGAQELAKACVVVGQSTPWHLSFVAEDVVPSLEHLTPEARLVVEGAANLHPERWRTALRQSLDFDETPNIEAARLLEQVGDRSDVSRLRAIARSARRRPDATRPWTTVVAATR